MFYNKKLKAVWLLSIIVFILSNFEAMAEESKVYKMTVNEDKIINNFSPLMYGINQEWSIDNASNYYLKEDSLETDPLFIDCYKDMIPLARMAGSSSQEHIWKNTVGLLNERKEQKYWGITGVSRYGMVEWIKSVKAADPDAKLTYTVNILSDSFENMADAVEFLRSDGTINYNGGVNWGQKRIEYGIEEPVDIFTFEIGNEVDLVGIPDVQEYIRRCKLAIAAIRSVDSVTPISVHACTSDVATQRNYDTWHREVLEELGDSIDMLSYHNYYKIDGDNKVQETEARIAQLISEIKAITGDDRIKVYQSEHASNRVNASTTAGYDFVMPHTMKGTIATAEYFLRMMWHPEVVAATYHSTHSSSWCIAYRDDDGIMKRSAIGDLLKMMKEYACGNVVESNFEGFKQFEAANVMGQALKTEKGLNIVLVNNSDSENTVELEFNGKYRLEGYSYIQSDDYKADNYIGVHGINVDDVTVNSDSEIRSYVMPKYSVTILRLEKTEEVNP